MFPTVGPTSAGAADVDGDGSDELILVGDALPDGGGGCQGSPLVVISGDTLIPRREWIPGIGLDGAAIGRFGSRGGDDLIAYVHDVCDFESRFPLPRRVAVVDLTSGEPELLPELARSEFGQQPWAARAAPRRSRWRRHRRADPPLEQLIGRGRSGAGLASRSDQRRCDPARRRGSGRPTPSGDRGAGGGGPAGPDPPAGNWPGRWRQRHHPARADRGPGPGGRSDHVDTDRDRPGHGPDGPDAVVGG